MDALALDNRSIKYTCTEHIYISAKSYRLNRYEITQESIYKFMHTSTELSYKLHNSSHTSYTHNSHEQEIYASHANYTQTTLHIE